MTYVLSNITLYGGQLSGSGAGSFIPGKIGAVAHWKWGYLSLRSNLLTTEKTFLSCSEFNSDFSAVQPESQSPFSLRCTDKQTNINGTEDTGEIILENSHAALSVCLGRNLATSDLIHQKYFLWDPSHCAYNKSTLIFMYLQRQHFTGQQCYKFRYKQPTYDLNNF